MVDLVVRNQGDRCCNLGKFSIHKSTLNFP